MLDCWLLQDNVMIMSYEEIKNLILKIGHLNYMYVSLQLILQSEHFFSITKAPFQPFFTQLAAV